MTNCPPIGVLLTCMTCAVNSAIPSRFMVDKIGEQIYNAL